eukprot:comp24228_c0_seq1/m.44660 comp24228_c0_seq1/g.44660  ORF comp24228_c0_seq1/g.44660 comp24228_c0_seq1/m.44660 type:complete len:742 (-) comp24228_c0_seq1:460-2685(-)
MAGFDMGFDLPKAGVQLTSAENAVYQAIYNEADPAGTGKVSGSTAVPILSRASLPRPVLQKIWEMTDTKKVGFLNQQQFFAALKLVALAQSGRELSLAAINTPGLPLPNLGQQSGGGSAAPVGKVGSGGLVGWAVSGTDKMQYDQLFNQLQPVNGMISGAVAKEQLMKTQLPVQQLAQIWELSDVTKDGKLDAEEFAVAMHLVKEARAGRPLPAKLPLDLIPPSQRAGGAAAATVGSPAPASGSTSPSGGSWVVPVVEKLHHYQVFKQADRDGDGKVTGEDVKPIFQQSNLPQPILAQIWNLVDFEKCGRLDDDQFALAMYLVTRKQKGTDVPSQLTPDMVPPSWRSRLPPALAAQLAAMPAPRSMSPVGVPLPTAVSPSIVPVASTPMGVGGLGGGAMGGGMGGPIVPPMGMAGMGNFGLMGSTLDMISKEVVELERKKAELEAEIKRKEALVEQRTKEVGTLETELQTVQTGWAEANKNKQDLQTKLALLEKKYTEYQSAQRSLKEKYEKENAAIATLQQQIAAQSSTVKAQEDEVRKAQEEINSLKDRQTQLKENVEANYKELDRIAALVKTTHAEITEIKRLMVEEELAAERTQRMLEQEKMMLNSATSKAGLPAMDIASDAGRPQRPLSMVGGPTYTPMGGTRPIPAPAKVSTSAGGASLFHDPFAHRALPTAQPFRPSTQVPQPKVDLPAPPKPVSAMSEKEQVEWLMQATKNEMTPQEREELELRAALEASLAD